MKKFMKNKMDMSSLMELERKQEAKAATPVASDVPPTNELSTPVGVTLDNSNNAQRTTPIQPTQSTEQRPILQPIPGQPPLPSYPPPPDSPKVKKEIEDTEYDLPTGTTDEKSAEIDLKPKLEVIQSIDNKLPPLCRDYVRGSCRRPGTCKFSHEVDFKQLVGVYTFCKNYQNSICILPNCRYVHATVFEEQKFYRTGKLPPHVLNSNNKKIESTTPSQAAITNQTNTNTTKNTNPFKPPPPPPIIATPVTATITSQFMPPVASTSQMMNMPMMVPPVAHPNVNQLYNVPPSMAGGMYNIPPEMQFSMPPPNMASNHYNMAMMNNNNNNNMAASSSHFAPTQMPPPNQNAGRSDTNFYDFSNAAAQTTTTLEAIKDCRSCHHVKTRLLVVKDAVDRTIMKLDKIIKKKALITRKKHKIIDLIITIHNKPSNKMTAPDNTRFTHDKNESLASILAKLPSLPKS